MKDDRVYLGHILEAIQDIQQYASAGREAFMTEKMRQDALIRKLELIGRDSWQDSANQTAATDSGDLDRQ